MAKDNTLTIGSQDWDSGTAQSAFVGNQELFLLDTKTKSGVLRVNQKTTLESSTTVNNYPTWTVRDDDIIYGIDRSGYVYKRTSAGVWSDVSNTARGVGQGLAFWKGHLFAFRDTQIDISSNGGTSWTTNWNTGASMGDSTWHPTFVATDDVLYWGCGQYVGSLKEIGTFDPTDTDTYELKQGSSTNNALDLPDGTEIRDIEQLGGYLYFATNNENEGISHLYPWDTTSTSFNNPIVFGNIPISAVYTFNNLIYIFDRSGGISITNGSSIKEIARMPGEEVGTELYSDTTISPASTSSFLGKIYFTAVGSTSAVWSLDGSKLVKEYIPSSGEENASAIQTVIQVGNVGSSSNSLVIGWKGASTQGFDLVDTTRRYTGYQARFVSRMYVVGRKNNKRTFKSGELLLGKPLVANEGIKIYYRTEQNGSWTLHQTITGTESSYEILSIGAVEKIQIKMEITTPSATDSTPEILQLSLY